MPKLAINGGEKVRVKPFAGWPVHGEREKELVNEVLSSGKWWYGEKVHEFEEKYAAYHDATLGITTTSGTTALETAILSLGIGAGDEVIVPPYTFMATASSVLKMNAVPIFVDIELDTWNIDPQKLEDAITERTKAILPVHFAGLPANMDEIKEIAKKHNLGVIEDAAQAWGSIWNGTKVGAIGDVGCFSFQMSKNITAGEGGILLTNNEEIADQARSFINCGRGKNKPWYEHYILGTNYRMTEIQGAILLAQLERFEQHSHLREKNAAILTEGFSQIDGITPAKRDPRVGRSSNHLYLLRYDQDKFEGLPRERFIEGVNAEGVPFGTGYDIPLYKNPFFQNMGEGPKYRPVSRPYYAVEIDYTKVYLPNCERICKETVGWLKHSVLLGTEEDMKDIIRAVEKVVENVDELL